MKRNSFVGFTLLTVMLFLTYSDSAFGFAGGTGSVGDPWQIATKADLEAVNNDLSADYVLLNDIVLTDIPYTRAVIAPYEGNSDIKFTGSFNGDGNAIIGLTINGVGNDNIGLIGLVDGAEIKNLGIENCDIRGHNSVGAILGGYSASRSILMSDCYSTGIITATDEFVGGLAGAHYGDIINSYSTAKVSGLETVGGLTGQHYGSSAAITNCYSTGAVSGSYYVGGLAGKSIYAGSIAASYSTGSVSGEAVVGGLVGYILGSSTTGHITNCYSTGEVRGDNKVGGLLGDNREGKITNCYSSGVVSGNTNVGGLCGYQISYCCAEISNCFWDKEASLMTAGYNQDSSKPGTVTNVVGIISAQMKQQTTFITAPFSWDFTTPVWEMLRENEDYPRLAWQPEYAGDIAGLYGVDNEDFSSLSASWTGSSADMEALREMAQNWLEGK